MSKSANGPGKYAGLPVGPVCDTESGDVPEAGPKVELGPNVESMLGCNLVEPLAEQRSEAGL